MNISLSFVRTFFICLSLLFATTYTTTILPGGLNFTNFIIGSVSGLMFSALLFLAEYLMKGSNLRTLNVLLIGLMVGYLLGEGVVLVWNTALTLGGLILAPEISVLMQTALYFVSIYFGIIFAIKASEEFYFTIPFIKFKPMAQKKKDLLIDWTVLGEARILDLASSGLLDDYLIMPKFMVRDLYAMLESTDENIKSRAKRCFETLLKLEAIPKLELRYSEIDFSELGDSSLKLVQLARHLDANIITSEVTRFQQGTTEGVRIINIQTFSPALKPITGEQLSIKVQRFGKEPRQGVGYLDDGTMVVVNGGAEFIGATIKAHVLSVKHTTSGRMIFCNVAEELLDFSQSSGQSAQEDSSLKNYYTVG